LMLHASDGSVNFAEIAKNGRGVFPFTLIDKNSHPRWIVPGEIQ
jgi:hypothetical protein